MLEVVRAAVGDTTVRRVVGTSVSDLVVVFVEAGAADGEDTAAEDEAGAGLLDPEPATTKSMQDS